MNNILNLIKINLSNSYNLNKQLNAKNKKRTKLKKIGYGLLFLYLIIYLFAAVFFMASETIKGLLILNCPHILLIEFMVLSSILTLMLSIFKINGSIFNTKDYDLLISLPLKSSTIILSKLIVIYIESMVFILMVMLPAFIVYAINVTVTIPFTIMYFFSLLLIPIIPLVIATLLASIIAYLSSFFKSKNAINFTFALLLMVVSFYFSFNTMNFTPEKMADFGVMFVDIFNRVYPMTRLYVDIIKDFNFLSLTLYIVIPSIILYIYISIMKRVYVGINSRFSKIKTNAKYKMRTLKISSPLKALFYKDLKRYLSSYLYVLNTSLGLIFMTLGVIALLFFGEGKVDSLTGMEGLSETLKIGAPLILALMCLMNSTTEASISIEGKSLNLLKSLPVSSKNILLSKVLVNVFIVMPFVFICATILTFYFKLNIATYLLCLIIPFLSTIFIAQFGLIMNLAFPVLDWDNEIRVIKQSMASFITIMAGIFLATIPIVFIINMKVSSVNLFTLIITVILIIIDFLLYLYLKNAGIKKFETL